MKEQILCAAVWFDDGTVYAHQPTNIKTGLVFCGYRHSSIFAQMACPVKERHLEGMYEKEQGFLTSENRFVDRQEAMLVALASMQVSIENKKFGDKLYSEDLY